MSVVGQLASASFVEGSFDVCVLADVIEHVRDPHAFLTDVCALLDRHAIVYLATPNVRSLSARLLRQWWPEYKREHLYYFSPATLTRLLTALDFTGIRISWGEKILTPAYVFGHFDKHPVPSLGALIRALEACTPACILQRERARQRKSFRICWRSAQRGGSNENSTLPRRCILSRRGRDGCADGICAGTNGC
jgi:hypothetical protein